MGGEDAQEQTTGRMDGVGAAEMHIRGTYVQTQTSQPTDYQSADYFLTVSKKWLVWLHTRDADHPAHLC